MIIVMGMLMFLLVMVFLIYTSSSNKPHNRVSREDDPIRNYNSLDINDDMDV